MLVKNKLIEVLDFFYPLFRSVMSIHIFRYACCGVINVCVDVLTFYIGYHTILKEETLDMGFYQLSPHIGAYLFSFCFTFPIGFFLSKYVVWIQSNIPGRIQLYRYFLLVLSNILINIVFLKFFIEVVHLPALLSKLLTVFIVICFSYISQKHFTFKVK